ncbi:hypothetical protein DYI21_18645 [Thalassospira tepidiphila]|uniref:hypothetical protein n=1 Tax=Thalassospira tepidiphila TaxID=393657 RepID=UPI001BD0F9E4|nr:hypothetical protein [Thalassospira tepidiphila]MBS8275615.1 hypothetical protein [Thalassospira tepidiphila]
MADILIVTIFGASGLGLWFLLCYVAAGAIVTVRLPRWTLSVLICGGGLALLFAAKAWALLLFGMVFVVTMFQISNGSGRRASTDENTAKSGEMFSKAPERARKVIRKDTKEKCEPITGSRVAEIMLFDGDPIRIKRARKIKKTFGHYPWYTGGDL